MRVLFAASVIAASLVGVAQAQTLSERFDGMWDTTLTCPNNNDAQGFSFQFESQVISGKLHGQKGTKDQPGWLSIDGPISPDGKADLYVNGIVGAAPFAVGQRPAGTQYGYHVSATFNAQSGNGHRVEGRPCVVDFVKSQ